MKKVFWLLGFVTFSFMSCQSKSEKTYNTIMELSDGYVDKLNNASSKEEYKKIKKEYRERTKFEVNKLTEKEKKEFERSADWQTYNKAKNAQQRVRDAERRAVNRFNN
jgi:hypothetical protein